MSVDRHGQARRIALRVFVASCAATTAHALADEPAVRLDWRAPEGCPDAASVERDLRELLLYADVRQPNIMTVLATAERVTTEQYRARIVFGPPVNATREVMGESCAAIGQAVALVIAIAIDPDAAGRASIVAGAAVPPPSSTPPTPVPSPSVELPTPVPPPSAAPPALEPRRPESAARLPTPEPALRGDRTLFILGELDDGTLPSLTGGAMVAGELRLARAVYFGVGLEGLWPRRARHAERNDVRVDVGAVGVGVRACLRWPLGSDAFRAGPCVGAVGRLLVGRGVGVPDGHRGYGLWLGSEVALAADIGLGGMFSAFTVIGASFPLARPEFVIEGLGAVHRPASVSPALAAGVGARF